MHNVIALFLALVKAVRLFYGPHEWQHHTLYRPTVGIDGRVIEPGYAMRRRRPDMTFEYRECTYDEWEDMSDFNVHGI